MQFKPSVSSYMLTMIDYFLNFKDKAELINHLNGFQNGLPKITDLRSELDERIPTPTWLESWFVLAKVGDRWMTIGVTDRRLEGAAIESTAANVDTKG